MAGSNGHVAWGFTNSYGQWFDWIKVPAHPDAAQLTRLTETIAVKGGADVTLDVVQFAGDADAFMEMHQMRRGVHMDDEALGF